MKVTSVLAIALVILSFSATANARLYIRSPDRDFDVEFAKYKSKFLKSYASPAEEATARKAYEENMLWAAELSKQNPLATFGETAYTDVPRASFKATHHSADFTQHMKNRKPIQYRSDAGSKIDWRTRGAVTPIKNQLNCGGCWSFSTTGNIEGQWFLAGNPLTSLSEQELLSCDLIGPNNNNGCHGGLMDYAFQWLINNQNGTIVTENSYPFVSGDGNVPSCSLSGTTPGAQIYSYHDLPQSESKIAAYVYDNGPVSIGVDAASFQTYTGGIMTNCQYNGPDSLDHAVLIVGYDDTYSTPYWIVKNQWGTIWGESGYIRLAKGSNQCGISDAATTSLVKRSSPLPPTPPTNPPPPPSPPSPTPPTPPTPSGSNFTFSLCTDSQCQDCQSYSLVQGTCIDETFNGDSFVAQCSAGGNHLTIVNYVGSTSCSGQGSTQTIEANTCYENVDGQTYVSFSC